MSRKVSNTRLLRLEVHGGSASQGFFFFLGGGSGLNKSFMSQLAAARCLKTKRPLNPEP